MTLKHASSKEIKPVILKHAFQLMDWLCQPSAVYRENAQVLMNNTLYTIYVLMMFDFVVFLSRRRFFLSTGKYSVSFFHIFLKSKVSESPLFTSSPHLVC